MNPCGSEGCIAARARQLALQAEARATRQRMHADRLGPVARAALESALNAAQRAPAEHETAVVPFTGAGSSGVPVSCAWAGPPPPPPRGPPIEQLLQNILQKLNEMHQAIGQLDEMHQAIRSIDGRLRAVEEWLTTAEASASAPARQWNGWAARWEEEDQ